MSNPSSPSSSLASTPTLTSSPPACPQERFEGDSGEAFWSGAPKTTFSRTSLLMARKESIAKGHSTKFQEATDAEQQGSAANTGVARRYEPAISEAGERDGAGRETVVQVEWEWEPPPMRRASWGSASSARRRHAATVRERPWIVGEGGEGGGVIGFSFGALELSLKCCADACDIRLRMQAENVCFFIDDRVFFLLE